MQYSTHEGLYITHSGNVVHNVGLQSFWKHEKTRSNRHKVYFKLSNWIQLNLKSEEYNFNDTIQEGETIFSGSENLIDFTTPRGVPPA